MTRTTSLTAALIAVTLIPLIPTTNTAMRADGRAPQSAVPPVPPVSAGAATTGLTAVPGVKVGHYTMPGRPTGCTVILPPEGSTASVDVRGGAPATKETDLLNPVNLVQSVNAVVLSGGSAFGLDSSTGVMRYLEEHGIGYAARGSKVPIVPAASLIDLAFGGDPTIRPNADCGYKAAQAATDGPVAEGNVGAGAGATVGKIAGFEHAMKAGLGTSSITLPNGLVVGALVAVNAVGDIIDPATSRVIAGARKADGKGLEDARTFLRSGAVFQPRAGENTTLGVIATNARLTKVQALKIAQMAHDGYARAISPTHTAGDGDTIFAIATGSLTVETNVSIVGALAAEAMADAIVRAATQATALGGLPAARDLGTLPRAEGSGASARGQGRPGGPGLQAGHLFGLHLITVKLQPGATLDQFKAFFVRDVIPEYEKQWPGLRGSLVKSVRGDYKNRFAIVWLFETEAARDKYFNADGTPNELEKAALAKVKPIEGQLSRFGTYTVRYMDDWVVQ